MLKVNKIKKQFNTPAGPVTPIQEVSFSLKEGTFAAIIGKSGSGKSTLLSLLGALDKPSEGSIEVDGKDISTLSDSTLTKYRREKVGFVFQSYNLIPNLTALENVMLPMEFANVPSAKSKTRAINLLSEVGIDNEKQDRKPTKLSGGEQQRVAIARALANRPEYILADEPTGNLDSNTSAKIVDLLKDLSKKEKTTIIVVTHDLNMTRHADVTFQLQDGKLIEREKGQISTLTS